MSERNDKRKLNEEELNKIYGGVVQPVVQPNGDFPKCEKCQYQFTSSDVSLKCPKCGFKNPHFI